jgi:ABC-2 type transport system permease protein
MRDSAFGHLILKDWRLQRIQIIFSIVGGVIALAIVQRQSEPAKVVGSVWFFIALIMVGTMLPLAGIVNERKKQNLAFLMSLPISAAQYTTAKLISTLGMFLIPWLTLVISAVVLIEARGFLPRGVIPMFLILALLPFVGLAIITAASLVGESEGWGIGANVFCSSSYGLVWYFFSRVPALMVNTKAPAPVWSSTELTVLGSEIGLILLILGLTFYLQSRKRDFV